MQINSKVDSEHDYRSRALDRQQRPEVSIAVQDFGPIAEGKVDIRPLTVFAGPSNTGKSWLAILIYAMWRALPPGAHYDQWSSMKYMLPAIPLSENLDHVGMSFFPEKHELWSKAMENGLEIELSEKERKLLGFAASDFGALLDYHLVRSYGMTEPQEAIRWGKYDKAEIYLQVGGVNHKLNIGKFDSEISSSMDISPDATVNFSASETNHSLTLMLPSGLHGHVNADEHVSQMDQFGASHNLVWCIDHLYRQGQIGKAHYLPADRGGIMHTHVAIVKALIANASHKGIREEQNIPELSGVLSDFMMNLLEMADTSRSSGNLISGIDQGLTENVLSGTIEVERLPSGYPRFVYCPRGRNERLSLVKASSMVSEVGPLALYLKHAVSAGDLLILEEPEAHLHPELQRLLMVEVVKWVKQGVRVLLTTHSDWIISELSNQVARGIGRDSETVNMEDNALNKEDVGVWRFERSKECGVDGGSSIMEVEWDPYGAGYETGFYDVFINQNNEWAAIMNRFNWKENEQ